MAVFKHPYVVCCVLFSAAMIWALPIDEETQPAPEETPELPGPDRDPTMSVTSRVPTALRTQKQHSLSEADQLHAAKALEAKNQNTKKSIAHLMRIWKNILQRVF